MKILITGASSRLGRAIAEELGKDHNLRLVDTVPVDTEGDNFECVQGSLLDPDDAWKAVRGIDALIHTGEPLPGHPDDELKREEMLLDLATRGSYNIFDAAISAGVKKLICTGTLAVFGTYPDDVYISEMWKPLPSPEMEEMTTYLGELTCREFARDYMVTVTCLRLGELVVEEEVEQDTPDLMWLDLRDAAHAFRCALDLDTSNSIKWAGRWGLFHICADIPNPKFLIDSAQGLGYQPTHNFSAHYDSE